MNINSHSPQPPSPSRFLLLAMFLNFVFSGDEFKSHSLNFRLPFLFLLPLLHVEIFVLCVSVLFFKNSLPFQRVLINFFKLKTKINIKKVDIDSSKYKYHISLN